MDCGGHVGNVIMCDGILNSFAIDGWTPDDLFLTDDLDLVTIDRFGTDGSPTGGSTTGGSTTVGWTTAGWTSGGSTSCLRRQHQEATAKHTTATTTTPAIKK